MAIFVIEVNDGRIEVEDARLARAEDDTEERRVLPNACDPSNVVLECTTAFTNFVEGVEVEMLDVWLVDTNVFTRLEPLVIITEAV